MTSNLSDLLQVDRNPGGRPCSYRRFLNTLEPEDRASIEAAMQNPDVSARHIWQVLKDHLGANFSASVLHHHRAGMCRSCSTTS